MRLAPRWPSVASHGCACVLSIRLAMSGGPCRPLGPFGGHRRPDRFHAMPARQGAPVPFNGWHESVTVQVSRSFDRVVVAHLVAQSRDSLTLSSRRIERKHRATPAHGDRCMGVGIIGASAGREPAAGTQTDPTSHSNPAGTSRSMAALTRVWLCGAVTTSPVRL